MKKLNPKEAPKGFIAINASKTKCVCLSCDAHQTKECYFLGGKVPCHEQSRLDSCSVYFKRKSSLLMKILRFVHRLAATNKQAALAFCLLLFITYGFASASQPSDSALNQPWLRYRLVCFSGKDTLLHVTFIYKTGERRTHICSSLWEDQDFYRVVYLGRPLFITFSNVEYILIKKVRQLTEEDLK